MLFAGRHPCTFDTLPGRSFVSGLAHALVAHASFCVTWFQEYLRIKPLTRICCKSAQGHGKLAKPLRSWRCSPCVGRLHARHHRLVVLGSRRPSQGSWSEGRCGPRRQCRAKSVSTSTSSVLWTSRRSVSYTHLRA